MRVRESLIGMLAAGLVATTAAAQSGAAPRPPQTPTRAEAPPPAVNGPSPFSSPGPLTPLKIQIVISRYQGDRKISSLPYALSVNANDGTLDPTGQYIPHGGPARIRAGSQVPVPDFGRREAASGQNPAYPVTYKPIGTNIDCSAHSTSDGRFRVRITIDDTSVYADNQTAPGVPKLTDVPSFRNFQSSNNVILKDGQTTQFTASADKITGEITRIDVTLTVEK